MVPETGDRHQTVEIVTPRGTVRGILYPAEGARGAIVMVGGAGGDITGPAKIYEELGTRLQVDGATALRLEYARRTTSRSASTTFSLASKLSANRGWIG